MDEHDWLAERFEANRTHLRAVAYRMLGSLSEADDAVQEAWLRLSRSDTSGVENLRRLADDGRRAGVPRHAALAQVAARGAAGPARARADREPRGRSRPRARGAAGRLGRPRAARGARDAGSRRAARVRAARHVRPALRRDRSDRGALAGRGAAAREPRAPPGAGSGPGSRRRPRPPARGRRRLPRRRRASGDFDALLAVLDPDVVLRADRAAVPRGRVAGGPRRAGRGRAGSHVRAAWRLRTAGARERGRGARRGSARAARRGGRLHDRGAGRSSRSTCSPTPSACASST